ncbi:M14 family metallopeptidase [Flagellimonas lutaonensis]|uniref:Secreted protein containing N-terminal zinc-dependent carboxypeptidase related domain n=1 Tax=Flagellimonas lutaonensis TaxID=516051 RepID=A0A0D5YQE3_9FLAO|nr:M14 family metallopeptidase [Allomuricauda lutaonensis]AKA34139.1 Secreted protein containing N-terminal zinc-dependent carboxypeptidase related domain [Allomuricauda lutaonensis]
MKKKVLFLLIFASLVVTAQNDVTLNYYLPDNVSYDPSVPTPKEIIGHEVGEWHVTHDKLAMYMQILAEKSDRITIENRGSTFEGRPILLLTVTSPENHQNIEKIRQDHIALTENGGTALDISQMPIVVYQGFSIHGNEPSGSNAALAYAYHLAAAQGPEIEETLNNMVILLDPSFNPDGLQRFAYWANVHRSQNLNPDPNEREYHEVWPGGRTNHYWFDMNRDWLPVQLPESRARIETFHKWLPNILTDHHEMGTNSTFFFQPGEPSRVHPLTPKINQELTAEIGTYHAKALDRIGSLYYSEENYDDYYYGKGSTFPDVNGSIGILFEQGSSRGHIQESENGILTFPFTVRNQFTTALSTIEAAKNMRAKILDYQRKFYADVKNEGARSKVKGYIFGDTKDRARAWHLAEILNRHKLRFHELAGDVTVAGKRFKKGAAYVVPMNQKNPRLLKAMFEKRTAFTDSLFYDVSAWTFPLAFNLDYTEVSSLANAGDEITDFKPLSGSVFGKSNYAYLFEWQGYYTPKALNMILQKGLRAKVAKSPFTLEGTNYDYGTIMVPVQNQKMDVDALHDFLQKVAKQAKIEINAVTTGLTQGIDLGSNDFDPVKKQNVAILVGDGVRSYDAGEIWHLFDTRYDMKITKIDTRYFNSVDLSKYTDLILPSGWGSQILDKEGAEKIKQWVRSGGTVIGYRNVAQWFKKNEFMKLEMKEDTLVAKDISYDQKQDYLGAQVTGGAIFEAKLDRSHPIGYGYTNDKISLFRNTNIYLKPEKNSYDNPIQYTNDPLQSGYISEENEELIKNSVPFKVRRLGRGRVILFTDNTNFRAFWYGTNKLLMNAIFFGQMM